MLQYFLVQSEKSHYMNSLTQKELFDMITNGALSIGLNHANTNDDKTALHLAEDKVGYCNG